MNNPNLKQEFFFAKARDKFKLERANYYKNATIEEKLDPGWRADAYYSGSVQGGSLRPANYNAQQIQDLVRKDLQDYDFKNFPKHIRKGDKSKIEYLNENNLNDNV
jgi:hypothetical protein